MSGRARRAAGGAAGALLALALAAGARGATTATMTARFTPDRLGASTSVTVTMAFTGDAGSLPAPVSQIVVHTPAGMGVSTAGLQACPIARLEANDPSACPADTLIGWGTTSVAALLGASDFNETAQLGAYLGLPQDGRTVVNFFAVGRTPVQESVLFDGVLEGDVAPYGDELVVTVPAISTVPGGPNASVVSFTTTLGAPNIQFPQTVVRRVVVVEHVGGRVRRVIRLVKRRELEPVKGITVPRACPAGGFPFAADFTFQDGTTYTALATVPCP